VKFLASLLLLISSACVGADEQNCYDRPADFMDSQDYWKGIPPPVVPPAKNVIKLHRTGTVTWNGVDLGSTHHGWTPVLDQYLEVVPQLSPQPLTFLEWEEGAPCETIMKVRGLMRKHLNCDGSRECLQGPFPD
jgi:hypothetical protein